MIPASGAGGREFDSRITPFFYQRGRLLVLPRGRLLVLPHRAQPQDKLPRRMGKQSLHSKKNKKNVRGRVKGNERKRLVRTGTRTQNLLLRRQAPYPLGHTDIYGFYLDCTASRTRHSSLGVEHSLSKRKVVGSNPACGFLTTF